MKFDRCLILSSSIPSDSSKITQKWLFRNCKFRNKYQNDDILDFTLNILKNQKVIKNLSLVEIENEGVRFDIFTYLVTLKDKRSLAYKFIVAKTIDLILNLISI